MYVITNRQIKAGNGLDVFGKTPNEKGPNELLIKRVVKTRQGWKVSDIPDKLTARAVRNLADKFNLDIDQREDWHGSLKVACELFDRAREAKRSILFYVHGYNNDVEDVLIAAHEIERLYNVIVVPITWPANGGGALTGTAAYRSDKADARASADALNRVVGKIQTFHHLLTEQRMKQLSRRAQRKYPNNPSAAQAHYTQLVERDCPVTLNLLCHSMGNYLFKHTLKSSGNTTSKLVFDNICLVAADTNRKDHRNWVGQLDVRKRVYVVINENDFALKFSRRKPGAEQLARLGHSTHDLDSPNAYYLDVTDASNVGNDHAYFKGEAVTGNAALKELFDGMFNGRAVEAPLVYHADRNCYRFT